MKTVKPKSTELEVADESVSLIFQFGSTEEADIAFDEIGKAMNAGKLVVSCGPSQDTTDSAGATVSDLLSWFESQTEQRFYRATIIEIEAALEALAVAQAEVH